jgi:hypothetical protein
MKVGDLVQWTELERCYFIACGVPSLPDLTKHRNYGIIVDNNGINFFVRWENGDFKAAKPNTIEVISEAIHSDSY